MCTRQSIINSLREYYNLNRISVSGESFCCEHLNFCNEQIKKVNRVLSLGAEAHVGTEYGSNLKIVVVSLDTGGTSDGIANRTKGIEGLDGSRLNPHMRGTTEITRALLNLTDNELPYKYFSMINAAKCSGKDDSMNKVPDDLYYKCFDYSVGELSILKPQIIITQGSLASNLFLWNDRIKIHAINRDEIKVLQDEFEFKFDWLNQWLQNQIEYYLRWVWIEDRKVLNIITPHPAARFGIWQKFRKLDMQLVVSISQFLTKI